MPASELADRVKALDSHRAVMVSSDVGAALEAALTQSRTVCVAGSIFLAGAVLEHLEQRDILR
jgi:folylpolyglutamate synthase/dihydropteroate synthase